MRVVHVVSGAQTGVAQATVLYAKGLRTLGHEVTQLHLERRAGPADAVDARTGIRELTLPTPRDGLRLGRSAAAFFRTNAARGDVYHFHSVFVPQHLLAARLLPAPYVVSPHGGYQRWQARRATRKRLFRTLLDRRFLGGAAALHALTEAEALSIERYCRPDMPITIVPNGVEPADPPDTAERAAARERLGVAPDELAIVFIGRRDVWMKGLDLLFEGAARAKPELGRPLRLLIAGPSRPGDPPLETQIPPELGPAVHLLPTTVGEAKRELLAAADIFAAPSRWEGMPLAPMEALTHGVPVVGTEATGQERFLRAERAGETVPTTADGVAQGLRAVASRIPSGEGAHVAERQRISRAACAAFSHHQTAAGLVELYSSILEP